jgi:ABC-type lipoprotein release transport system permease subunit
VSRDDLIVYALTVLLMAGVAAFASWLPARRAGQVDPVESLRVE